MTSDRCVKRVIVATMFTFIVAMAVSAMAQDNRAAGNYVVHTLPLPDNGTGDVSMDYIAFDPATNSLWVPAGQYGRGRRRRRGDQQSAPDSQLTYGGSTRARRHTGPRPLGCEHRATASSTSAIVGRRRCVRITLARLHKWRVSIWTRGQTAWPMSPRPKKCG
jgi:hypothetical protein